VLEALGVEVPHSQPILTSQLRDRLGLLGSERLRLMEDLRAVL